MQVIAEYTPEFMALNVQTRWAAFAVHLLISLAVLAGLLSIIFFVWFPYDLIFAGGVDGLKIVMGVDLVLGPVLTLMVFVPGKKGLKSDLTMIGLVQVVCLVAGMWVVHNERPMVQVLADDGVHILAASDFKYYQVEAGDLPGPYPKHALLNLPEDKSVWGTLKLTNEIVELKPLVFRGDLYLPAQEVEQSRYQARLDHIQGVMSDADLQRLAALNTEDCSWLPVHSKHVGGFACITQQSGVIQLSDREF
ncbi:MAG: hypothetical protein AAF431_01515 [Pseudomonadota bacterium]